MHPDKCAHNRLNVQNWFHQPMFFYDASDNITGSKNGIFFFFFTDSPETMLQNWSLDLVHVFFVCVTDILFNKKIYAKSWNDFISFCLLKFETKKMRNLGSLLTFKEHTSLKTRQQIFPFCHECVPSRVNSFYKA